ncbi:MAG TPA: bifunctional oligoribonuclease/PAP phosphatase NrnA [Candidatus Saccharimonadales bacterium]
MNEAATLVNAAQSLVVIQGENPDGDSLSSALALEAILTDLKKTVTLVCAVDIPKYLRFLAGWDRVIAKLPAEYDLAIIVDASTQALLTRTIKSPAGHSLAQRQPLIIDHHSSGIDLPFAASQLIQSEAVSTGEIIYQLAKQAGWPISADTAGLLANSIMSDSLGLTSPKTTAKTIYHLAELVELGANLTRLDELRRALNKKPVDIFYYKGQLFERVELALDGRVALVVIPWEEIEQYSDAYNPSMLIIDEMRLIEGVEVAAAFKTYPDGKITCKLRANPTARFMNEVAEHFGGGGHPFAAGFKVFNTPLDTLKSEFINQLRQRLET